MSQPDKGNAPGPITRNIPNLLTVLALCAGLTSIRMTLDSRWEPAIYLILLAVILDGLDGRMARFLDAASDFGAELDSLADFLNFGIAPALLVYNQIYQDTPYANLGWAVCLCLVVCCMLRLARFNTAEDDGAASHFVGIPAPALAFLALLPIYLLQTRLDFICAHVGWMALYLLCIAGLAISTIQTVSIKRWRPKPHQVRLCVLTGALALISLLAFIWYALIAACFAYLMSIILSVSMKRSAPVHPDR